MRNVLRLFSKSPAFVVTVALIMALGIGSCTAIFSLVKEVLLTRLPYRDAGRLAIIWHSDARSTDVIGLWPRDYETYRDTSKTFRTLAAFATKGYNVGHNSETARITCGRVTSNLFPMMAIAPSRGRWLDEHNASDGEIVLSHDLWRSRFGSDPGVVGKRIQLDLKPYTVVGVMPDAFTFPPEGVRGVTKSECWIPAAFSKTEMTIPSFDWVALGALKPDISFDEAQHDASSIAQRILESYPAAVQKEVALRAAVVPLEHEVRQRSRTALLVFAGSVGFLLLIGCANVANLMLARLHNRRREIAIRAALGATRSVLCAQVFIESLALAGCGGILGIPLAFVMMRVLVSLSPGKIPMLDRIHIDLTVLGFSVACSVLTGMAAGLLPAVRARNLNLSAAIADGSRGASAGLHQNRFRFALAAFEIGLAFVLLIGAGLLSRSFIKLSNVAPGFDPTNVLTFSVSLPDASYPTAGHMNRFIDAVLERIGEAGDVRSAAAASGLPIGPMEGTVFSRVGAPPAVAGFKPAFVQVITPEYLRSLGIAVKRGRSIEIGDDGSRIPVALVNEAMAQKYWPDTDVIGKQLYWLVGGHSVTVVGVVADVRQEGLAVAPGPMFYVPFKQVTQPVRHIVFGARTSLPAPALPVVVRRVVAEIDPALPLFDVQSVSEVVRNSVADQRFNMFVVAVFAVCALVLSVMGLYAVISHLVIHSSHEFGVRIALGASPRGILTMVMGRGLKVLVIGMALGSIAAVTFASYMRTMLFGVSELDWTTLVTVTSLLSAVALLSILIPAVRAMHTDPVDSLR